MEFDYDFMYRWYMVAVDAPVKIDCKCVCRMERSVDGICKRFSEIIEQSWRNQAIQKSSNVFPEVLSMAVNLIPLDTL